MKNKKIIGVFLACALVLTACGSEGGDKKASSATSGESKTSEVASTSSTEKESGKESTEQAGAGKEVKLVRGYGAPHGTKAFGRVALLMDGDKILKAQIEEFQYSKKDSGFEAVPNGEKMNKDGESVLISKLANKEKYSQLMKEHAKATKSLDASYQAIEKFVEGKTAAEIEKAIGDAKTGKPVDAISESTLVDTVGYVKLIVETAKSGELVATGKLAGDGSDLKIGSALAAAHGEDSFADAVVVMEGDKIVAANLDEFQYLPKADAKGVPNSDKEFAAGYPKDQVLGSKKVNNEYYSGLMKEHAKATKTYAEDIRGIEGYTVGKTASELEKLVGENKKGKPVDAISESTMVDSIGYVDAMAKAAKNVK